eukprot:8416418-Alexandrium_andersonii.AAC.1
MVRNCRICNKPRFEEIPHVPIRTKPPAWVRRNGARENDVGGKTKDKDNGKNVTFQEPKNPAVQETTMAGQDSPDFVPK